LKYISLSRGHVRLIAVNDFSYTAVYRVFQTRHSTPVFYTAEHIKI